MRITRVCHLGTSNDVPEMTGESGLLSEWRVTFPISAERELNLSSGIRVSGFGVCRYVASRTSRQESTRVRVASRLSVASITRRVPRGP